MAKNQSGGQLASIVISSHIDWSTFMGNLYKKVKAPSLAGAFSGHMDGSNLVARYRDIDEDIKKELDNLP